MADKSKTIQFKGIIQKKGVGMFVEFPRDVKQLYGTAGQVRVNLTFDKHPYRGALTPMGERHHLIGLRKNIAEAIGKGPGDIVLVTVALDAEERPVDMPADLIKLLGANKKAKLFFETLSYTNRKEYAVWIASAVKIETRAKRLGLVTAKLLAGKKNPSEK